MFAVAKALFKCQHCGNCCNISREIGYDEIRSIANLVGESIEKVSEKLNQYPCGFLDEHKLCSIYYFKPNVCTYYPNFAAYDICPAYRELANKIYLPGIMNRVCSDQELAKLYTKIVLNGNIDDTYELLERLKIVI